jgi:hypothetical protein
MHVIRRRLEDVRESARDESFHQAVIALLESLVEKVAALQERVESIERKDEYR